MKRTKDTRESKALDQLVEEARQHLDVPAGEWERLEARLSARVLDAVAREKPAVLRDYERARANERSGARRQLERWARGGAAVLAAAAAVALFLRHDTTGISSSGITAVGEAELNSASSLRATEGSGEVRVNRVVATPGYVIRAGDTIEADGARGVFERTHKVTWLLESEHAERARGVEDAARAHVKRAGEPLVIGLESGAIEAQVTPVPSGEAFAVDVGTDRGVVRVAVHGTHLRVARTGDRVTVDLTEGVVSIGAPPRIGATVGTLVTAPAHVELDAKEPSAIRVDHVASAVRTAIPLAPRDTVAAAGHTESSRTEATTMPPPALVAPAPSLASAKGITPREPTAARSESPPATAREAISRAVRDCAAARGQSGEVHVTVTSNLSLRVSASGEVESAQFAPPLLPEIQTCAAQTIYRTKLEETGSLTIPIEYSY
jgi:hypothetical protein